MKTTKILFPIVLLAVLSVTIAPVLAGKGEVYEYAVFGSINNPELGIGGQMLLKLNGRLTLQNPDFYDEDVIINEPVDMHTQQQFDDFTGPQWSENGANYRAEHISITVDLLGHRDFTWTLERWYTMKTQWSGGITPQSPPLPYKTFELRLIPDKVERQITQERIEGDLVYHEVRTHVQRWDNNLQNWVDAPPDQTIHVEGDVISESNGMTLNISFSGTMNIDGRSRVRGTLRFNINKFTQNVQVDGTPWRYQEMGGINGDGNFGPYSIGFSGPA
jgi:hypothetical protein